MTSSRDTYMVDGNKLPFVLKHHDLIFGVPGFGVFPIIDGYLDCFGAVFTRHVEYSAAGCVLVAAEALLSDTGRVVDVWIRRCRPDGKPSTTGSGR